MWLYIHNSIIHPSLQVPTLYTHLVTIAPFHKRRVWYLILRVVGLWWQTFVWSWNGSTYPLLSQLTSPGLRIPYRCLFHGIVQHCGKDTGFNSYGCLCPPLPLPHKELLLAAFTRGHFWTGKTIMCHSNNEAVVSVINIGGLIWLIWCTAYSLLRLGQS